MRSPARWFLLLASGLAVCMGCAAVWGLDETHLRDADSGASADAGDDADEVGRDATPFETGCPEGAAYRPRPGCPDHAWACWSTLGQSPGAGNYRVLTLCGDDVVRDETTGLMWARKEEPGLYSWEDAQTRCRALRLAGFDDWRLPTRVELTTLVDFGKVSPPTIDATAFPTATAKYRWTASPYPLSAGNAFVVLFDSGNTGYAPIATRYGAHCVR